MVSQIAGVSIVHSTVCSGADQRKHQCSASLPFVRGIHRCPVIFPHKGPVTRKMFPFDDNITTRFLQRMLQLIELLKKRDMINGYIRVATVVLWSIGSIKPQSGLGRSHLQAIDVPKLELLRRNCHGNLKRTIRISNFNLQKCPVLDH